MIDRIISGGQTGVDRAALDAARKLGVPHGGWCPKGRKAEDGVIHTRYRLAETASDDYSERTKLNIRDSDGTLILVCKLHINVTDGTVLTIQEVKDKKKPFIVIDLSKEADTSRIQNWLVDSHIKTLNIAGPRESQSPGIYDASLSFLEKTLAYVVQTIDHDMSDGKDQQDTGRFSRL